MDFKLSPKTPSLQETKAAHKCLAALGNVVKALTEHRDGGIGSGPWAPYRESKLTSLLKEALGGNCKTTFFVTASPSSYTISETINTIHLGQRVRRVNNFPFVNREMNIEAYKKWLMRTEITVRYLRPSSFIPNSIFSRSLMPHVSIALSCHF